MQRQVITAENVRLARLAGQTALSYAKGDIVTQQAQDDAKRYGIQLHIQQEEMAVPEPVLPITQTIPVASSVLTDVVEEALRAQVRAKIREVLPAGIHIDDSFIAEAIHKVLGQGAKLESNLLQVDSLAQNWGGKRVGGIDMIFLTEEQVRERCHAGGEFRLASNERLTPSAVEFLRGNNCKIIEGAGAKPATPVEPPTPAPSAPTTSSAPTAPATPVADPTPTAPADPAPATAKSVDLTWLDAQTQVSKSHPRIFLRGRLDTLIAETVLVQTSLAGGSHVSEAIKNGLADINAWIWQILQAEVSGNPLPEQTMCGMNTAVLRQVALDPVKYLNQGHIMPDPSLGPCVALLNWLRARVREVEVSAVQVNLDRQDLLESLDALSSAVYVLMLLTVVAESGREISRVGSCGKP